MKHAKRLQSLMLGALFMAAGMPSWAVVDSPGGPAVREMTFQQPVTQIATEINTLHNWMLGICLAIFIAVFGVMLYSIMKHRKSLGHQSASFHESTAVEIGWTVVPFIIIILMALPATRTVVAMKDTSNADLTIKATGMQWKWGYDYLKGEGEGISFLSNLSTPREQTVDHSLAKNDNYLIEVDNPLIVPVNKKIRIVTTANDVIHSWGVPAFGVKQDGIPGFVRDTWFRAEKVGVYRGQCYELCGKEHAYMPIHVKVVSAQEYTAWVGDQQKKMAAKQDDPNKVWQLADIVARGEKVYTANCAACHQPNGKGGGPILPLDGSPIVNDADKTKQIHVVLNGRNAMPSWKQLSDTDIAAVISYTKNHWSNKTGQVVQPSEVLAQRGK